MEKFDDLADNKQSFSAWKFNSFFSTPISSLFFGMKPLYIVQSWIYHKSIYILKKQNLDNVKSL